MMRWKRSSTWVHSSWLLAALTLAGCASEGSSERPDAGHEVPPTASDGGPVGSSGSPAGSDAEGDAGGMPSGETAHDTEDDTNAVGRIDGGDGATSSETGQATEGELPTTGDDTGTDGVDDAGSPVDAPVLPEGVLLYVYHQTADSDLLIARHLESGDEAIITDLTGDGSSGWEIDGFSISPDRRRIALASLYAPTEADVATGLATRAIWTLAADGTDFVRLTPTFPNDSQGRQGFSYEVDNPEWTADGSRVLYNFGTYWWDGSTLEGGSFPWIVDASGESLPTSFTTSAPCTVIHPARNPITGEFLFIHSVCVPGEGAGSGLYLYSADASTAPQQLVASTHEEGGVDVFLSKAAWLPDGSGFLFLGGSAETDWSVAVFIYDMDVGSVVPLVLPPADGGIDGVTVSPDASKIVYCVRNGDGALDLRLIDLGLASPTDVALTSDGKSCEPSF